ncbi:MAG: patatin-like phospholipase family protein [Flavobacteriales bacterium]|nr:patatin-like phospholipase family protein [Flavobacteriales bacterium]
MTSSEIANELNSASFSKYLTGGLIFSPEERVVNELERFIEDPNRTLNRTVDIGSGQATFVNQDWAFELLRQLVFADPMVQLLFSAPGITSETTAMKRIFLSETKGGNIANRIDLSSYVHSLLFNRGILPGLQSREYFSALLSLMFWKKFGVNLSDPGALTFKDFFYQTGVDLVITGTNVSKRISRYFSVGATPDFPVVEAVSISMNIPFVFKPILINHKVTEEYPENHRYNREYQGLWVDGGMLLNFPLHAFGVYAKITLTPGDEESYQVALPPEPGQVTEFNDKVLGFRLVDTQEREFNVEDVYKEDAGVFGKYAGDLLETLMYGGAEGQIRTGDERAATIGLNTAGLDTLDFAGPEIDRMRDDEGKARLKERLIREAYEWTKYKLQ